jgi:hypothetical protein
MPFHVTFRLEARPEQEKTKFLGSSRITQQFVGENQYPRLSLLSTLLHRNRLRSAITAALAHDLTNS